MKKSRPFSMTLLLFIGLVCFLSWASLFEIEQTVRARGQIIPGGRTQIIQTADGGVLVKLLVQEGDHVVAGQLLAVLEKERVRASYEEIQSKVVALKAALIRARAEAEGYQPVWGKDFEGYTDFVLAQRKLYEQRKQSLEDELNTLKSLLDMAEHELSLNESLLKTGDISRLEVIRSRQKVSDLRGKIKKIRNKYIQDARQESVRIEAELASARYKLEERKNVLEHTDILSPVAGIVKYLRVNTLGGVLRPGDELMQISPTESEMLIEIKVNPVDIGQLKPGLPASIKLDAFDYTIFGIMEGTLAYISPDTLMERVYGGVTSIYYRCRVKLNKRQPNSKLSISMLKPGMTATVDIKTNNRTVLQYLLKPILRAFSGAMNER
jgi:adhesin transport system membrane fusion protein